MTLNVMEFFGNNDTNVNGEHCKKDEANGRFEDKKRNLVMNNHTDSSLPGTIIVDFFLLRQCKIKICRSDTQNRNQKSQPAKKKGKRKVKSAAGEGVRSVVCVLCNN